jgi:hypothetical protein
MTEINIQECKYHIFLTTLTEGIYEKLDEYYNWHLFDYWLGDESNFARVYREAFEVYNGELTEAQLNLIEKKGKNLESTLGTWLQKWRLNHPNLPNEKMPLSCLKHKIYEYIAYQLKQPDMRGLVGNPC